MIPAPTGQNETYIGQRLLFRQAGEVEVRLNDVVNGADARRILKRAILGSLLIGFASAVLSLLVGVGMTVAVVAANGTGSGFAGLLSGLLLAVAIVGPLMWLVVVLFVPEVDVLSDWNLLLDGQADLADTAYGVVWRSLTVDRRTPVGVSPRRVDVGPPVRGVRNMLHISLGKYYSYVSVFAFGHDLYLGWTLWRRQLPIGVVLRWMGSLFRGDPGYSGAIEMEPIKAMREAVHNALRQAIEAGVTGKSIPLRETFGHGVPGETPNGASRRVTVQYPAEAFSADNDLLGHAEPGVMYEVVSDDEAGVVLRDGSGSTALIKDRAAVQW